MRFHRNAKLGLAGRRELVLASEGGPLRRSSLTIVSCPPLRALPFARFSPPSDENAQRRLGGTALAQERRSGVEVDFHVRREQERGGYVVASANEYVEPPAQDRLSFRFFDQLELGRSHRRSPVVSGYRVTVQPGLPGPTPA